MRSKKKNENIVNKRKFHLNRDFFFCCYFILYIIFFVFGHIISRCLCVFILSSFGTKSGHFDKIVHRKFLLFIKTDTISNWTTWKCFSNSCSFLLKFSFNVFTQIWPFPFRIYVRAYFHFIAFLLIVW